MFCKGCGKDHNDRSWKFKDGWYCTKFHRPTRLEFIPDRIRDDRVEHFNSIVQPFRQGELSKEYVDLHGTEGINVTAEEARKCKNTWCDLKGHNTRSKSK